MSPLKKSILLPALAVLIAASACTDSKTNTTEEIEIKTMDSTSKAIKENNEKLEDQTKKVEESLEKLDKEEKEENNN